MVEEHDITGTRYRNWLVKGYIYAIDIQLMFALTLRNTWVLDMNETRAIWNRSYTLFRCICPFPWIFHFHIFLFMPDPNSFNCSTRLHFMTTATCRIFIKQI